jgi:hypothetical protein
LFKGEWDEAVLEKKSQDLIAITRSRYLTVDQNPLMSMLTIKEAMKMSDR